MLQRVGWRQARIRERANEGIAHDQLPVCPHLIHHNYTDVDCSQHGWVSTTLLVCWFSEVPTPANKFNRAKLTFVLSAGRTPEESNETLVLSVRVTLQQLQHLADPSSTCSQWLGAASFYGGREVGNYCQIIAWLQLQSPTGTLYNQEISVCLLLIFCQLQCFAVNSTVSFYMMKYIAMYNFCLEFKHIDEKQIFTLTLAYILVAFSEVRGNSNAGSVVESFLRLRKVGAPRIQPYSSCTHHVAVRRAQ